jgi:hypothetical protein
MPRKKPGEIGKKRMNTLTAAYHPDAVKYMLDKHGNDITDNQAKEADQEWAAKRTEEFAKGKGRVNSEIAEHIMQEPPLGASIPMKRSQEFDYAKANVGIQGMAVSESAGESEARFTKPTANFDTSLARP